jgi:hypothetical protein
MNPGSRRLLGGLLLLCALLLAGCDEAEADLFIDLGLDWAREKGLIRCQDPDADPAGCAEEPTPALYQWVAGEGAEQFTEGTILDGFGDLAGDLIKPDLDEGAEDVLDTAKTAKDLVEADALAEEGFAEGDPEKIKEAIAMRENDWSYDEMLSAVYLAGGDATAASDAQNQAEDKIADYLDATLASEGLQQGDEKAYAACQAAYFNLYDHREAALLAQIDAKVDADPPQDAGPLIGYLDLVRNAISGLENNAPGNPCQGYTPAAGEN